MKSHSSREQFHLLAPCQESLWLLNQVGEPGSAYTLPFGAHLRGSLDTGAWRRACQAVVARHPLLRAVINGGRSVVVDDPILWREHELPEASGEFPAAVVEELVRSACLEPFDFAKGPLIRFDLARLGHDEWFWLAVAHHIVFDGVSKTVFVEELSRCYRALVGGDAAGDEGLDGAALGDPGDYWAYAVEDRQRAAAGIDESRRASVGRDVEPLTLPLDRRRPPQLTGDGAWVSIEVGERLRGALSVVAEAEGATMFQLLTAVLATLLHRYGNRGTIPVATAMGTRTEATPRTVGFFVNNVPVVLDVDAGATFAAVLAHTREQLRLMSRYRRVPLTGWMDVFKPPRTGGVNPLNQVGIAYQAESVQPVELPGVTAGWQMFMGNHGAKCDLLLQVLDRYATIDARLEYSTELFDRATAERMAGHLVNVLEEVASSSQSPVGQFPILGDGEARQILTEWNATSASYPDGMCTHELFEAQAARTPGAVAVVAGDGSLTYADLDHRAGELAAYLRSLGVCPGVLVGCCLERSVDLVVALLAIWKAGGAYVPLDPGFPADRLAVMFEDSSPAVLVTQRSLAGRLPAACQVVLVDAGGWLASGDRHATGEPQREAPGPRDLGYVIYTSGSTGRPKGVMIEHRSLVNFLTSMVREPGISASDIFLAVTSLSFDIAGLELFGPLIRGARVVMTAGDAFLDGREIAAALESSGATVMQATPVSWGLLLDSGWTGGIRPLKALCGGEALSQTLAARILATGAELWNLYGPTETTVWSALLPVDHHEATRTDREGGVVAVGRPIANTQLYVLDAHRNPVPAGVWGELYIGGDGLARGYLNRPELTAERFVPDPLAGDPGARMYRTGDLARFRPDGIVEFGGRLDNQVKLRGFRIEPGDIEAALLSHERVQRAAVAVQGSEASDKRLVGYLVLNDDDDDHDDDDGGGSGGGGAAGGPPTVDELRAFLRARLPPYMVPSAFVVLDDFPLTPNGKLDRKALPVTEAVRPDLGSDFVAPRSQTETALAAIWSELLGLDRIGVDDDFFDLGGNSILATQMVSRARDAFGVDLPLRAIFDAPTVAALAAELEASHSR